VLRRIRRRSSITLIDATTKPTRDETRQASLALKGRLKLATRSWSGFAAAEVSYQGYGPRVVPAEMR
jgi:hypothetical protein